MPGGYNALTAYPPKDAVPAEDNLNALWNGQVVPGTRGTIFPAAQYDDGKYHLAWPGLLAAPIEGFNRMWDRGDDANISNPEALAQNSADSFDAAGGAMTGGLAAGMVGAVPEGALTANNAGLFSKMRGILNRGPSPEEEFREQVRRTSEQSIRNWQEANGLDLLDDPGRRSSFGLGRLQTTPADKPIAAIKVGAHIFTGVNHAQALENARHRLNLSDDALDGFINEASDGFLFGDRFATREEAMALLDKPGFIASEYSDSLMNAAESAKRRKVGVTYDPSNLYANSPTGSAVPLAFSDYEEPRNALMR